MRWFGLSPKDRYYIDWTLFQDEDDRLELRGRYHDRKCAKCGKVDEYAAVRSGIDDGVAIRAKSAAKVEIP